jgi:hypothetical protein
MVNNSTNIKQTTTIISHLKSLNIIKKKTTGKTHKCGEVKPVSWRSNQLAGTQPFIIDRTSSNFSKKNNKTIRFSGHDAF